MAGLTYRYGAMASGSACAFLLIAACCACPSSRSAPPVPTEASTPSNRIQAIIGDDPTGGVPARIAAARRLQGQTLSPSEIAALRRFVSGTAEEAKLPLAKFNHLRNDILTLLVQHTPAIPGLSPWLCGMYHDKAQGQVWRDYCIQFLGQAYPRLGELDRREALEVLHEAASNASLPTAGTALIALCNNVQSIGMDRSRVMQLAVEIAASEHGSAGARMTAFQICVRLRADQVLPHARRAATGESAQSVTVRMTAIAALGDLGDESDHDALEALSNSSSDRIRKAAAAALRRLATRTDESTAE